MKLPRFLPLLLLAAAPAAAGQTPLTPSATTYNYYVATTGSDANPGTFKQPFQTILRASKVALPGTTIHVLPGVYTGGFKTSMSGTAAQRIYYVSTVRWGARLVPPMSSDTKAGWDNRGDFVDIIGFDVDGSVPRNGTKWTHGIYNGGSYTVIKGNRVHHVAQNIPCDGVGGAGIGVDSYYHGVQSAVVGNTVHDIGPASCRFVHGIYISTSGSAKNNLVHNVGGAAIQLWHDANNVIISNNTVAASMTGILVGGGDYYHTRGPNDHTSVYNNIVYDNKYGIAEKGETGPNNTYRNNLVFQSSTADWQLRNGLGHTGTVARPPEFVRYARRGGSDFRLRSSSPAIGKGNGVDIGAYPFN
jgi:hypothetical protein